MLLVIPLFFSECLIEVVRTVLASHFEEYILLLLICRHAVPQFGYLLQNGVFIQCRHRAVEDDTSSAASRYPKAPSILSRFTAPSVALSVFGA